MKKQRGNIVIFIVAALALCGALAVGGCMLFGWFGAPEEANAFESLFLRESGMRITEETEVLCQGETSVITRYELNYADGEQKRIETARAEVPTTQVLNILNTCAVLSWDGFYGKHPKHVLDGTMFSFTAVVNGKRVQADGSQNFPKHYHEFTDWLNTALREST